jgi:hypothetical protein
MTSPIRVVDDRPNVEHALGYAERRGWRVLPLHDVAQGTCSCTRKGACRTPGKHPRLTKWQEWATTDKGTVAGWWKAWPNANIGILTGAASGIVVLDLDPRNGGDETLQRFITEHGPLPKTVTVATGGGGFHFYFAHPGGRIASCELGPGLELKADGGFVIGPPSLTGEAP